MPRLSTETIRIGDTEYPVYDAPLPDTWVRAATEKGYRVAARVIDRYHVALACELCGTLNKTRAFTLRVREQVPAEFSRQ